MKRSIYGMIVGNTEIQDNKGNIKQVYLGEIVRVISIRGNVAIIKPYNSKKRYTIGLNCINTNIVQSLNSYTVVQGIRILKG